METERSGFISTLKRKIALDNIIKDEHLQLTDEQNKEIQEEIKKLKAPLQDAIRGFYRTIAIPDKDGYKEKDLGIPPYGLNKSLDEEIFEQLRLDGEILEKIAPIVLKEKYLKDKDYVLTDQLYQSTLKTSGESRPVNRMVLEYCIREGVQMGLFGLGELVGDQPRCLYFKEIPNISFAGQEIIIKEVICKQQKEEIISEKLDQPVNDNEELKPTGGVVTDQPPTFTGKTCNQLSLQFEIPKGKVAQIMGVMNLLQSKFDTLELSLKAKDGSITQQEIEDKIEETFRQLNVEFNISDNL